MSRSITIDEAISSLQGMFPSYDAETLKLLLSANSMNVERTVETIFQMEGGGDVTAAVPPPRPHQPMPRPDPYSHLTAPSPFGDDDRAHGQSRGRAAGTGSASHAVNAMMPSRPMGPPARRRVDLPEDFLRPPGWRESNITLADEQLAMMLQNEMFQREAQAVLGANYPTRSNGNGTSTGTSSSASASSAHQGPNPEGIPDMGILKGLSSMGEQARRSLNNMALRFQAAHPTQGDKKKEKSGLLSHADEEEEEVINFQGLGQVRGPPAASPHSSPASKPLSPRLPP